MNAGADRVATRGQWVSLRPVRKDDYPAFFAWRTAPDVYILNFPKYVASHEDFESELTKLVRSSVALVVEDNQLRIPIGFTMGYQLNQWDGWMFVGAYVEPEFRRRGHGGEASSLAMDFMFRLLPLRMVYAEIYDFSTDALGICQAMGFEEVGYQPEHYWRGDQFWGLHRLMLTRERWAAHRERFFDILDVQEDMRESDLSRLAQ